MADGAIAAEMMKTDTMANNFGNGKFNDRLGDGGMNGLDAEWPGGIATAGINVATLHQALRRDMQELFHQNLGQVEDSIRKLLNQQTEELLAFVNPNSVTSTQHPRAEPSPRILGAYSPCSDTNPPAQQSSLRRFGDSVLQHVAPREFQSHSAAATRRSSWAGLEADKVVKTRRLGSYANVRLKRTAARTLNVAEDDWLHRMESWWENVRSTRKGTGWLARFVDSSIFSAFCIGVILFHAVLSTSETNQEMENAVNGRSESETIDAAQLSILAWYVTEVCLRIYAHRLNFFFGDEWAWNIFDFVLVCFGLLDAFLAVALNLPIVRSFRILKVVRVLRTVRAARFFSDLRLMVVCIAYSLHTLFWCILLLFFIQYLFSMVLVQGITSYITETAEHLEENTVGDIVAAFGTVEVSSLSLWMSVTGGQDWIVYYNTIKGTGWLQAAVFVFYIAFFVIAAFNIVTGTFVNKAFTIARPDPEMVLRAKELQDREFSKKLANLFQKADVDSDGVLFKHEFMSLFEGERHALLEVLGMSNVDAASFFEMLTDGDGDVSLDLKAFVTGILMLSGPARSIDVHIAEYRIMKQLEVIQGIHKGIAKAGSPVRDGKKD